MKKQFWKRDWFWIVALPTALIGVVILVALLLHLLS
jgi:hypothetical protein